MTMNAPGKPPATNTLRPWIWGGAACLLLLPAVAMQLDAPGVEWTVPDFIVMGLMLAVACGLYELGAWLYGGTACRAGFGIAVVSGVLTVWTNLAVGMLGDEGHPANLMFLGVILVATSGAFVADFKAPGMARAMCATAAAQVLAACVGLAMGFGSREVVLTAAFALPWLASAGMFRRGATSLAGRGQGLH
jgi:hypothetical protein